MSQALIVTSNKPLYFFMHVFFSSKCNDLQALWKNFPFFYQWVNIFYIKHGKFMKSLFLFFIYWFIYLFIYLFIYFLNYSVTLAVFFRWLISKLAHERLLIFSCITYPAHKYLFKVNNRNTRRRCGICSKLKIKIPVLFWCLYC